MMRSCPFSAYPSKIGPIVFAKLIQAGHWKSANISILCFPDPYVGVATVRDSAETIGFAPLSPDNEHAERMKISENVRRIFWIIEIHMKK